MSTKPLIVVSSTPSSTLPFLSPALFPSPLSDSTLSPPSSTLTHLRLFPLYELVWYLEPPKQINKTSLSSMLTSLSSIRSSPGWRKLLPTRLSSILTVDNYYKPDLKKTTLARHSVISKGLRVAKSHLKKRNMQA
ncbi:hypothetical protein HID58_030196 [Brassica napus]|uniref:Uncharacterized protein n=1 Tax=Brassica napus TaxID=3708 RepID=A0ABQ8CF84_BRANA|nr:hypothetical protein HID58_030196 [Brassica napus]